MMAEKQRELWRLIVHRCCLTVAFPVGLGSGLLPRPMVVLPIEVQLVEKTAEKAPLPPFFSFPR